MRVTREVLWEHPLCPQFGFTEMSWRDVCLWAEGAGYVVDGADLLINWTIRVDGRGGADALVAEWVLAGCPGVYRLRG